MKKFLFEALCVRFSKDQAANPYGVLAWSYAQSRVFDPSSVFDALSGGNLNAQESLNSY